MTTQILGNLGAVINLIPSADLARVPASNCSVEWFNGFADPGSMIS
jgi:hypothetical protein